MNDEPYLDEPGWVFNPDDFPAAVACYACGDATHTHSPELPTLCPGCEEAEYQRTLAFRRSKGEKPRRLPTIDVF